MTRTDIHRPKLVDPEAYEPLGAFYVGANEDMAKAYLAESPRPEEVLADRLGVPVEVAGYEGKIDAGFLLADGNFITKGTCDHCGASFAHGVYYRHRVLGDVIAVGHICADETFSLPNRAVLIRKRAEKAAKAAATRRANKAAAVKFASEHPEIIAHLEAFGRDGDDGWIANRFYADLLDRLDKHGTLTPNMVAAVERNIEKDKLTRERRVRDLARREADKANAAPVPVGRLTIEGEVLSLKGKDTPFGWVTKMLVRSPLGFKVWGTRPEALAGETFHGRLADGSWWGDPINRPGVEVGDTIRFTATVEPSNDDPTFGFFKRPTKATIVKRGLAENEKADKEFNDTVERFNKEKDW